MAFMSLVGAGISAVGTIMGGIAQKNALNYQAQVAQNNQIIAQQNAQYAMAAGYAKTAMVSMKERATGGAIKAAQAAGGVDVNTGSNKDVQVSQREIGKLETETEMNKAQLAAYGYRTQAMNFGAQAGLYRYEAPQAETGAELSALGQVTSAAGKWFTPVPKSEG